MGKTDELYALSQANSVDLSRDGLRPLQDAAKDHQVVIVLGYQEIDGSVSGSTLFNSCAIIDVDATGLDLHAQQLTPVATKNESLDAESVEFLRLVNLHRADLGELPDAQRSALVMRELGGLEGLDSTWHYAPRLSPDNRSLAVSHLDVRSGFGEGWRPVGGSVIDNEHLAGVT
mgnify:CR=1 FL=1